MHDMKLTEMAFSFQALLSPKLEILYSKAERLDAVSNAWRIKIGI
jgi:hypothetical protein